MFEVLAAAEAVAGRPVPHELAPRRTGDPVATFADPTYAEKVLDWRAEHGLPAIVETAYRWHLSQLG